MVTVSCISNLLKNLVSSRFNLNHVTSLLSLPLMVSSILLPGLSRDSMALKHSFSRMPDLILTLLDFPASCFIRRQKPSAHARLTSGGHNNTSSIVSQ